jgi:hypothetical protein
VNRYPLRVRLTGGRNTHAARTCRDGIGHTTACGIYLSGDDHWLDADADIRCRRCVRDMYRQTEPVTTE